LLFPIASAPIDGVADARQAIRFEEFRFKPGGVSAVSVHGVSWRVAEGSKLQAADPGLMGFILISNSLFFQINSEYDYAEATGGAFCQPLTSKCVLPLFRLKGHRP
jgi:hypothetical protein